MTFENQAAYRPAAPGLCRYTNVRAYVFGAIQIILGILSVGCGVVVTVCQGLGWVTFIGLWGGAIYLASGVFSVKASIKKEAKLVKIAMFLGIAAFIVSVVTFLLGVIGLYIDGVDNSLARRIDTALSSGVHVANVFVGIWGMLVTLFFVMSAWPYVVGTAPFINAVGPDMDPLTEGGAAPGKLTKEEAAVRKKQMEEEKKRRKQEEKERKQREKEEKERRKKEEQEAKKKKKAEEEEAKRKKKDEEEMKKGAVGGAGSRRASRRHPTGDEEPDSDFEYDSDEFDDDDDVIEGETEEERKRRRRQKAWQLHIKKRYIHGKDPFSKDRVYNKTWEKEPKEEFKENKTMELRRKMLEAKMKKK